MIYYLYQLVCTSSMNTEKKNCVKGPFKSYVIQVGEGGQSKDYREGVKKSFKIHLNICSQSLKKGRAK